MASLETIDSELAALMIEASGDAGETSRKANSTPASVRHPVVARN
jgi:hypothetical protein